MHPSVKEVLELFKYDHRTKISLVKLYDDGADEEVLSPRLYEKLTYSDISDYLEEEFYCFELDGDHLAICYLDPKGEWK